MELKLSKFVVFVNILYLNRNPSSDLSQHASMPHHQPATSSSSHFFRVRVYHAFVEVGDLCTQKLSLAASNKLSMNSTPAIRGQPP
jgi:hypothetical protein